MDVVGYKCIRYTFPKRRWTIVRYLVCDLTRWSAFLECRFGHSVNFDYNKTRLMWKGHYRADATAGHGLYSLEPKAHSRPRHAPDTVLIAPVAISSSYVAPEATSGAFGQHSATNSKIRKLWHKDYRPQTCTQGSMRSGRDNYWIFTSVGNYAVRAQLQPRRTQRCPGSSITGQRRTATRSVGRLKDERHGLRQVRHQHLLLRGLASGRPSASPTGGLEGKDGLCVGGVYAEDLHPRTRWQAS